MNDNAQKFTALTGMLMLIGASIFYALRPNTAIESSRPQESGLQAYVPPGYQHITERLWQDPLEAFASQTNSTASEPVFRLDLIPTNFTVALSTSNQGGTNYFTFGLPPLSAAKPTNEIDDLLGSLQEDPNSNQLHVLAVMLPGTQFAAEIEERRQTRYAVETAMLNLRLSPDDPIHIGASTLRLPIDEHEQNQTNLQVAFEWFRSENSTTNRFLVLWLREDDFYGDAPGTLYNILNLITANHSTAFAQTNSADFSRSNSIDFKLIGPVSSDMLKLLGSGKLPDSATNPSLWSQFAIYSPEATAPEANLWPNEATNMNSRRDRPFTRRRIAEALNCTNIQLKNWIATDDQLCQLLVQELANRGDGTVLNSNNVIVLVSEADTAFGRSLSATFRNEVSGISSNAQVWNFEYLRGLDGSKPASKPEERSTSSPSSSSDPQALIESALQTSSDEPAENDAQLDYAERLSQLLAAKDHELRRTNGAILAVGLFGTDVYDKLILLQALRPRLKEALFFTTDLDARLWMPSKKTSITRNVIVASGYSLEPPTDGYSTDGTFLPFRNVYQTAEFLATRDAVLDSLGRTNYELPNLIGQLFEIGRHRPVELKSASEKAGSRRWDFLVAGAVVLTLFFFGFWWTIGWKNGLSIIKEKMGWSYLKPFIKVIVRYWIKKLRRDLTAAVFIIVISITAAGLLVIILMNVFFNHDPHIAKVTLVSFIAGLGIPLLAIISFGGFYFRKKDLVADRIHLPHGTGAYDGSKNDPRTKDGFRWPFLLASLTGAFLLCAVFMLPAHFISSKSGEDGGGWQEGVSIWPTELIRSFVVVLSVVYIVGACRLNERHYRNLWWNYMREVNFIEIKRKIRLSRANDKGWNRIRNVLVANWGTPTSGKNQEYVDARKLLAGFIKRAHMQNRFLRTLPLAGSYLFLALACVYLVNGMPNRLCVRGNQSWFFDNVMLMLSIVSFLLAIFLSLDGARLTAKLLDGVGSRPTAWPQKLLNEWSSKSGVRVDHLDGYLDVRFAVDKTLESRTLMFFPFLVFLLLLLSRERYFDNWTWTSELVAVFAINFLLAGMCWWIVRRSAKKIRMEALRKLDDAIKEVSGKHHSIISFKSKPGANCPRGITFRYRAKDYAKRLKALYKEIEEENRGAFALWIQDPTYLALFLPTGITGIVVFLLQYWMPHS